MVHRIHPLEQHAALTKPTRQKESHKTTTFKDVFQNVQTVHVSKHAKERMQHRNIHLTDKQWQQIDMKMKEAKQKGVTDSIILTKDVALLASTKNHTIVTALNRDEATSRIFTNINGAILLDE